MLDVLLWERSAEPVFYFEESRLPGAPMPRQKNPRRIAKIRDTLQRTYHAVEAQLPLAERFCSHLRLHDQVMLHVPAHLSPETAEKLFLSFLEKCVKSHRRWLVIDGALALLGAALVWVPGPNIFFFYPALRALAHHLAQAGGRKHQRQAQPKVLHCVLLDDFARLPASEMLRIAAQIESSFGFRQLRAFLEKKYGNQH